MFNLIEFLLRNTRSFAYFESDNLGTDQALALQIFTRGWEYFHGHPKRKFKRMEEVNPDEHRFSL